MLLTSAFLPLPQGFLRRVPFTSSSARVIVVPPLNAKPSHRETASLFRTPVGTSLSDAPLRDRAYEPLVTHIIVGGRSLSLSSYNQPQACLEPGVGLPLSLPNFSEIADPLPSCTPSKRWFPLCFTENDLARTSPVSCGFLHRRRASIRKFMYFIPYYRVHPCLAAARGFFFSPYPFPQRRVYASLASVPTTRPLSPSFPPVAFPSRFLTSRPFFLILWSAERNFLAPKTLFRGLCVHAWQVPLAFGPAFFSFLNTQGVLVQPLFFYLTALSPRLSLGRSSLNDLFFSLVGSFSVPIPDLLLGPFRKRR